MHTVFDTGAGPAGPRGPAQPDGDRTGAPVHGIRGIGATRDAGSMPAGGSTPPVSNFSKSRVAIAGATGYTGQELLRILGRHPSVSVTAAMSSGSSSGSTRPLPALTRLWDGQITALSAETL